MRIFVSYSREDQRFAIRLKDALEADGYEVWIDLEDIPAGQKWSSAVQDGLASSDAMLLITTPSAIGSENVADEWQFFHSNKKPIIPVWLKPTEMPFQIDRLQRVDFTGDFVSSFSRLKRELARLEGVFPPQQGVERAARRMRLVVASVGIIVIVVLVGILGGSGILDEINDDGTDIAQSTAAATQDAVESTKPGLAITDDPQSTLESTPTADDIPANLVIKGEFVTVAQYADFLNGRPFPPDRRDDSGHLLLGAGQSALTLDEISQHWIVNDDNESEQLGNVTWYGAQAYCDAQDLVLPSADDMDISELALEWLEDGRIAGRGSIEAAAKTFASPNIGFRCVIK